MSSIPSTSVVVSVRETTGVRLPSYDMAPGAMLRAVEDASSVIAGSTDERGEYLAMSLVEVMPAAGVSDGPVIILPLTSPLKEN
jgi:methylmalonyl-CoA mutase cobalamin-binding subunit